MLIVYILSQIFSLPANYSKPAKRRAGHARHTFCPVYACYAILAVNKGAQHIAVLVGFGHDLVVLVVVGIFGGLRVPQRDGAEIIYHPLLYPEKYPSHYAVNISVSKCK